MPFGARIQYLVYVNRPRREVVGCLQFSSPAWRMKARDQWIGWNDSRRGEALQQVVNNSRFLVLAPIHNLASTMLSCTLRQLKADWSRQYATEPLLVETLVDRQRFHGGCCRAAQDVDAFYERRQSKPACSQATGPVLAVTADGKGIVLLFLEVN